MTSLIVAVDRNNAIGWGDGRLPWHLPDDLRRFKELTMGKTVVMGFKTFVSLNRPAGLPGRKNIVLTRQPWAQIRHLFDPSVAIISDMDYVRRLAGDDLCIIGGGQVYAESLRLGLIDEIYATLVDINSGADVKFPVDLFTWKRWLLTEDKEGRFWTADLSDSVISPIPHSYLTLRRLSCT